MARAVNKLTATFVAKTREPGTYGDGSGLYLVVDSSGAKRWRFLFRHGGRQREAGLGSASTVSLADARRRRDEMRRALDEGRDPIAERKKAVPSPETVAVTFGSLVDTLVPEWQADFRNDKHKAQWISTLTTYAGSLRDRPVADVCTDDVLAVLRPIWNEKSETASRVRGRIERVLDAAKARGLREGENPARWRRHLDHLLSKRKRLVRGHHASMPYRDVPAFVARLREREAVAARALEYLVLTAGRVGEVTGARWDEIDVTAQIWTVPGDRMKAGRPHRVPLVDRALEILREAESLRRGDYVFPSFRADRPLSNAAFDALMGRMGIANVTPHGFRSSFRDWAGDETAYPREVAEAALAHAVGDEVERAYRRGDALEKRRALMAEWAGYCATGRLPAEPASV